MSKPETQSRTPQASTAGARAGEMALFQLRQGGLLAPGTPLPADEPVDAVSARFYPHPLLGAQVVVRLAPDATAAAVDTEMDLLGFQAPQVTPPVALRRHQALGFPGWALVHDKPKAKYALEVMKEFKKEAKRASSKPGHAKDGFVAIATRLARAVPHFLPSFWEEAGRVFIDAGNSTYAAQAFEKARQAEAQYKLPVDEEVRAQSFLEFALSGALAVKSLSAYAKDLERDHDGPTAFAQFSRLAVRRTLGGMAPWASLPQDLRRLAKAAGRDVDDEDERFIEEVLDSPGLGRAPAEFWKQYRPALVRLSARSPRVRGRLLNLAPRPGNAKGSFAGEWLVLLEETAALEGVVRLAGEVPADAQPDGGAAPWLARLVNHLDDIRPYSHGSEDKVERFPEALFRLVRRMAPRLVADGVPLSFADEDGWSSLEVDLLDLLLELGVPVADPDSGRLNLSGWAEGGGTPGEPRPRDPTFLAADPRFASSLDSAYENEAGDADFEKAARGKQAFVAVRRRWLEGRVTRLAEGGLVDLQRGLKLLDEKTSRDTFIAVPEAHVRLEALDLAEVLATTLRTGILDELGWPELEATHAELAGDAKRKKDEKLELIARFPYLLIHNGRRAVVLSARGQVLSHDLRLPKDHDLSTLHYLAGQLLVVMRDDNYDEVAYWSSKPTELFKPKQLPDGDHLVELADGSVTTGGRAIHAGDTSLPAAELVLSDGQRYWTEAGSSQNEDDDDETDATRASRPEEPLFEELDPLSGKLLGKSWPPFLEGWAGAGTTVPTQAQQLLPAPGLAGSPLGEKGGLVGQRVRFRKPVGGGDQRLEVERIDGVRWEGPDPEAPVVGLLDLPGAERPRLLTELDEYDDNYDSIEGVEIREPERGGCTALAGGDARWCLGTPVVPPRRFVALMRPRDDAGSRALRKLTPGQARQLLEVAQEERAAAPVVKGKGKSRDKTPLDMPRTMALIESLLPGVTSVPLRLGIRGLVELCAEQAERLARFVSTRRPSGDGKGEAVASEKNASAAGAGGGTDGLDDESVGKLMGPLGSGDDEEGQVGETLRVVSAFLSRTAPLCEPDAMPWTEAEWHGWIGQMRALAHRAAFCPELDDAQRGQLATLLELWAGTLFAEGPADLRVVKLRLTDHKSPFLRFREDEDDDDDDDDPSVNLARCWLIEDGEHRYACFYTDYYDADEPVVLRAIERAPGGAFKTPKGAEILEEKRGFAREREWLERFAVELRARGGRTFEAAIAERVAQQTGLSRAEAALLVTALPRIDRYDNDFLGKELREQLGLKVGEAKAAKELLSSLDANARWKLFSAAVPEDPTVLWAPVATVEGTVAGEAAAHPVADALTRAWTELRGRRLPVPDEVLLGLRKDLSLGTGDQVLLAAASQPDRPGPFHGDGEFSLGASGNVQVRQGGREIEGSDWERVFTGELAHSTGQFLAYLHAVLPVGEPLRTALPRLHALALERLASPALMVPLGFWYADGAADERKQKELFSALGGVPYALERKEDEDQTTAKAIDTGALIVVLGDSELTAALRPARVKDWQDALLLKVARLCEDDDGFYDALQFLCSPGCTAIMKRIEGSRLPPGAWEQNALLSVPELVQGVSSATKVSEDGAVLYLQTLALPDPTAKNVQRWNGWKAPRYAAAAAELLKAKLLVTGKRQRAGRDHFLPGGWEDLKAPHLPLETWKLPLLGISREAKGTGLRIPMGRVNLLQAPHALFAAAWQRVEQGDKPAYDAVPGTR